jgi:hypothetical protein
LYWRTRSAGITGHATIITRARRTRRDRISIKIRPDGSNGSLDAGSEPGAGTFFCLGCGTQLSLEENDVLPDCSSCGGTSFRRDSIFEPMQEHGQTAEFPVPPPPHAPPDWLGQARQKLSGPGRHLAFRDDDETLQIIPLDEGWVRIGRSVAADVRLDHPSVSRRHAIIACEAPKALRILDDRSLNGVLVNGETVEWSRLGDGDEIAIGRYRLFVLES